jgi:hypothetical protein
VDPVTTDVSVEHIASIFRVTRIGELRTLAVASEIWCEEILVTLIMVAMRFSGTSDLTEATRRNIREDGILHCQRRENLKSYH